MEAREGSARTAAIAAIAAIATTTPLAVRTATATAATATAATTTTASIRVIAAAIAAIAIRVVPPVLIGGGRFPCLAVGATAVRCLHHAWGGIRFRQREARVVIIAAATTPAAITPAIAW